MDIEIFSLVEIGWGLRLTTHLHIVQRLRMSEAKLHFPFYSFMLLKGIALGLFALISIFYALFLCFPAVT